MMQLLRRLFRRRLERTGAVPRRRVSMVVPASRPQAPAVPPPPPIRPSACPPAPPPPPGRGRPRVQLLFEDGTVADAPVHGPLKERIDYLAKSLWPDSGG